MILRRREYLVETDQFKKDKIVWKVWGDEKQINVYVMDYIGVGQIHGRKWMALHLPTKSAISASSIGHASHDFSKLESAKKFAKAVYEMVDVSGRKKDTNTDPMDVLGRYGAYLHKGGNEDFTSWIKEEGAR
jgi:hypothetical protein